MTNYKNLHRFILFTTFCIFVLIIAGGNVTSTGSGLSVPDWPNTYGHFMFAYPLDQMIGGIFYEHTHRMIASVVGFFTTIVAIWLWKREERKWVRNLGFIALGTVILQGLLGGLTVLTLLPPSVSASHATLAQTFFCIMASIALFTSSWYRQEQQPLRDDRKNPSLVRLAVLTTAAVFIQLILGAIMRHTDSGLAVPDFPLAYNQLFPSLTPEALERYNQHLIHSDIRMAADGAITSTQILIHMMHRLWAVVVSGMIIWISVRVFQLSSVSKRISRFGYLLLVLLCVQITLGALTVISGKEMYIATAHVAMGSLILVSCVLLTIHAAKLFGIRQRQLRTISISAREAAI